MATLGMCMCVCVWVGGWSSVCARNEKGIKHVPWVFWSQEARMSVLTGSQVHAVVGRSLGSHVCPGQGTCGVQIAVTSLLGSRPGI